MDLEVCAFSYPTKFFFTLHMDFYVADLVKKKVVNHELLITSIFI